MMEILEKIEDFGQMRDMSGLQQYLHEIDTEEILRLVESKLGTSHFLSAWNYILQGFGDDDDATSHDRRFQIVEKILKELEVQEIGGSQLTAVVQRICNELIKFKTGHLVELCNYCIGCIQSNKVSQMSWKELFPELLNVIVERKRVDYNDTVITGAEHKHQLINSLCVIQWSPSIATSMASMFIDVPLTKDEHVQIVNKLVGFLEQMTPQEIPSFVYQLLKLAEHGNSPSIFFKLQNYFAVRVYTQFEGDCETNLDEIESSSYQEMIEAESTVLYHIHSCALLCHDSIRDYLSSLKNLLRSPEFILNPFQLTVLFTISTIPYYEEKVFEIVRPCISKMYHEDQKKHNSAWFRGIVTTTCKVESIIRQIIKLSSHNRDLVLQGLINFAFVLLNVGSALGRDPIAEKQWDLGNLILLKIIRKKRLFAPIIIQDLCNNIISSHSVGQHIECMYLLSKTMPLLMIENKSIIITLMEALIQMPGHNASLLLDALIPLAKVSPTIRDHFILFLRKALYSSVLETRQMALKGFTKLLTILKIGNPSILSQSSSSQSLSSGYSILTQISLSRMSKSTPNVFSNEALCLEILSILKWCFVQQAEVKSTLYDGLYDAVLMNSELGLPILELLWSHFIQFYNSDEAALPPLNFDKVTQTRDVNVTLQEPLGKLVYITGLLISRLASSGDTPVEKYMAILKSLSERMMKCELVHFALDDGTDLLDIMPDSQQKLLILKEVMVVYEALIGFKLISWQFQDESCAQGINCLYQGYSRFVHFFKNLTKKSDGKKKKAANNTTTTTQPLGNNSTIKKDGANQKSKNLKLPDTILDFEVIIKTLTLLHESSVEWATSAQASSLKSKKELHQHFMNALYQVIGANKTKKTIESHSLKTTYNYLCDAATILYKTIIKRLQDFMDFDVGTAVTAVDCFSLMLTIICNQYKTNLKLFLCKVGGNEKEDLVALLSDFVETFQKLFELEEEEGNSEDAELRKLSLLILNLLGILVNQIPVTSNVLANQMMEWTDRIASTHAIKNRSVVTAFINLVFDTHIKFKISLTFLEQISASMGDTTGVISEEETDEHNEFKIITEISAQNILTSLCNSLRSILENIEWIVARLRSECKMIAYPGEENIERKRDLLKGKERDVCCHLCFVVSILALLSNCAVPPGTVSENILKNVSFLYATLSSLTKYFTLRSSKQNPVFEDARFERLVKLAGKQLAPVVYRLIMYIEESQKEEGATQSKKKKTVTADASHSSALKSKVLRETRLIPKVVFEIEQFSKFVILLSNKTQMDLSKFVGQGTVRDFRIMHLKDVLERVKNGAPVAEENDDSSDEEQESEAATPPPSKKMKQ